MSSSRFVNFFAKNQGAWTAGLAVITAGTVFKVSYFNFSRGMMVDGMDVQHQQATEHLRGAREFGQKMAKEREDKAPPLTPEQKEQLQEYLLLLKEAQPPNQGWD
mmetsp:Transcript_2287/g.4860  ORF Transcript_2287/g.4860 Transcript_2287/m.4860 type:complete len:105 (+) Transcript_2287:146-460(+)